MSLVNIRCPHCGHTRNVAREQIPDGAKEARCRACERSFGFSLAPPAAPARPAGLGPPRVVPFVFTGTAREYFGIWIVNTLLKIVTLGIYSPWAKVRKRRYFYGNTLLEEAGFDYLANPLNLLKGWLIGAALFICYSLGSRYSPLVGMGFGVLFFFLMPWVVVRSRLFNNRNSAHRNVRFNFRPAYGEAYTAFAWLPLLVPFTAGVLAPYVYFRQKRFLMENNLFGTTPFAFTARVGDFYLIGLKTLGLTFLLIGGLVVSSLAVNLGLPKGSALLPKMAGLALPLLMVAGYALVATYAYVRTTNLSWNNAWLQHNHFVSSLRARDLAWIFFSNVVAAVLSCGLLIPWASIRLARYRLSRLALVAYGDLDHFRAATLEETSATGEEIGDIFGFDMGI